MQLPFKLTSKGLAALAFGRLALLPIMPGNHTYVLVFFPEREGPVRQASSPKQGPCSTTFELVLS